MERAAAARQTSYNAYFAEEWGCRWPVLAAALSQRTRHCALLNTFILPRPNKNSNQSSAALAMLPGSTPVTWIPPRLAPRIQALYYEGEDQRYPPPVQDMDSGLMSWYWLDPASLLPPLVLGLEPNHNVLDMCSAPGGKSLVLAHLLYGQGHRQYAPLLDIDPAHPVPLDTSSSLLVCNELDSKRRLRLLHVLKQYAPPYLLQSCIRVTGRDGKWWTSNQEGTYDRVLIDAPCSSDRHVVQQAGSSDLVTPADWTLTRCRNLAKEQTKLVLAGLKALKVGGVLVYSTCSIAAIENDQVIDKVLERIGGSVEVLSSSNHGENCTNNSSNGTVPSNQDAFKGGMGMVISELEGLNADAARHGYLVLPDRTGWGPIYLAVLRKVREVDLKRVKVNKYAQEKDEE